MATLSTSAWVLHDLGLAAGFGGPLFGRLALHRAVKDIPSESDRGKVIADAWRRFDVINALSLGAACFTWLIGRAVISGRSIDRDTERLVHLKDALLAATAVTSVATMLSGKEMSEQAPWEAVPLRSGDEPSPRTPPRAARLLRFTRIAGPLNIALTAGVIGVTTVLAMKSGRSSKWSLVSRLLP